MYIQKVKPSVTGEVTGCVALICISVCFTRTKKKSWLSVAASVGDKSTDTEEDARWTQRPEGPPTGADGLVGGTHTGSTGWRTKSRRRRTRETERERERTPRTFEYLSVSVDALVNCDQGREFRGFCDRKCGLPAHSKLTISLISHQCTDKSVNRAFIVLS